MARTHLSERKHIGREMHEYFSSDDAVLFSDENNSSVYFPDGLKVDDSLGSVAGIAKILNQVLEDINLEFSDPSKRIHGKHYTKNGRMYRWDANDQELVRVQTYEEAEFAKEFFSQTRSKSVGERNPLSCRFKKQHSSDSNWQICSYHGQCRNKERLTVVYCGSYGREWFCGPTCR